MSLFSQAPRPTMSVQCACGASMSLRHVARDLQRHTEEHEYVCATCGYHHIIELPSVALPSVTVHSGTLWTPAEPEKPKEPESEPEPPVINGSVIGYRAWRIKDWQLYGTGANRAWVPGVNEATCDTGPPYSYGGGFFGRQPHSHLAPALGCHCGITCLARFKEQDGHWLDADVFGAIEAWSDETVEVARPGDVADPEPGGRFILHGTGFRAQYGKVVLLAVDDDWPAAKKAAVRALAREHEADVCKHAHLEDAAKEHGQLVPDDMLAWAKEADPMAEAAGGYLTQPVQYVAGQMQVSMSQALQPYLHSGLTPAPTPKRAKGPRPTGKPGISQTLGYNGPPTHGKYRKNQRVRDRADTTWRCVRGGQPGTWEREEE